MKLLDWMQHKFHQTSNEHLITEFAPRNSCASLTDLQYYPKSQYCYSKAQSNKQREKHFRKSFACIESARSDKEQNEQEPSGEVEVLFHGFLAIGTLAITEPETPTFATSVENITWKETEATENELNVINGELEKVLRTEGSEKKEADRAVVCPLQTYLFGSVIGLPETTTRKKEHRASLGELFQRSKMEEKETVGPKNNDGEKRKEKSAVHLMKKILKGRTLYPGSAHKKPGKLQRMFHRKVHPESTGAPKSDHLTLFPLVDTSKKGENFCTSDSDGNRECWIKSDTEYLVLEVKGKKDGK